MSILICSATYTKILICSAVYTLYEAEQIRIFKKLILPLCTNLYQAEELVLRGIHHIPEVTQNTNTKANIIYGERRQQPKPL